MDINKILNVYNARINRKRFNAGIYKLGQFICKRDILKSYCSLYTLSLQILYSDGCDTIPMFTVHMVIDKNYDKELIDKAETKLFDMFLNFTETDEYKNVVNNGVTKGFQHTYK